MTLLCTESGFEIHAVDSANIAFLSVELSRDFFEEYWIREDEEIIKMGISVPHLNLIATSIKRQMVIKMTSPVTLNFIEDMGDKSMKREMEMNLMQIEDENFVCTMPLHHYDYEVKMTASKFEEICNCIIKCDDTMSITGYCDRVIFETVEKNILSAKIEITFQENKDLLSSQPIKLHFSCKYLKIISQLAQVTETVVLCLSSHDPTIPLQLKYFSNKNSHFRVSYFLASKIEEC